MLKLGDKYVRPADGTPTDFEAHHELAAEIAADRAVLMKNDGALPLEKTSNSIQYVSARSERRRGGKVRYQINIPPKTMAELYLKDTRRTLNPGSYEYEL